MTEEKESLTLKEAALKLADTIDENLWYFRNENRRSRLKDN